MTVNVIFAFAIGFVYTKPLNIFSTNVKLKWSGTTGKYYSFKPKFLPNGIGVDPVTDMIYVANWDDNTVRVINGQTNAVIQKILAGSQYAVGILDIK